MRAVSFRGVAFKRNAISTLGAIVALTLGSCEQLGQFIAMSTDSDEVIIFGDVELAFEPETVITSTTLEGIIENPEADGTVDLANYEREGHAWCRQTDPKVIEIQVAVPEGYLYGTNAHLLLSEEEGGTFSAQAS